jgi:gamma-glutamylcyclotransferase (GGCT)/AIG2-like uncharacterized protein YtfP
MDVFFYGTLMDADVLALVTGTPKGTFKPELGILRHFEARYVRGECYPALSPYENAIVMGHILEHFPESLWSRVCEYEGRGYKTRQLPVECVKTQKIHLCHVFMGNRALVLSPKKWDLATWLKEDKRDFMLRLLSSTQ